MKILVIGGTRFFGIHMVEEILKAGHEVTIATRGIAKDSYGERVGRIILERTNEESMKNALKDKHFDVNKKEVVWCDRMAFPYDEIKRQAEYALWQTYSDKNWIAVRYPFAIGKDDYTKRLQFYVEHTMKSIPMHIDNLDYQMGFIRSDEAGKFIAFLVDKDFSGAINGSSEGTISLREIITYVEQKTGTKAVIDKNGDAAPYNGEPEYSINTDKAKELGYRFSELQDWLYELLDYYIECGGSNQ